MICIDASLAVKWLLFERDSVLARAFYRACAQADEKLVAPHLFASEITNILRQRMRRGQPLLDVLEATALLRGLRFLDRG